MFEAWMAPSTWPMFRPRDSSLPLSTTTCTSLNSGEKTAAEATPSMRSSRVATSLSM